MPVWTTLGSSQRRLTVARCTAKWNGLMDQLHVLGCKRLGSFEALKRVSHANLRKGKYEQNGYKYLPGADISIQGVSANQAWERF